MRYINGLVLTGVSALALAACGGSSSAGSSTNAGASLSAQATAICKDVNSQIAALPAIKTNADAAKVGAQEIKIIGPAVSKLKALTVPSDKQSQFTQWTSSLARSVAVNTELLAALKAGDQAKFTTLAAQSRSLNTKGNQLAKGLGLATCSKDVQPGSAKSSGSST
jgi:hypothetical protein